VVWLADRAHVDDAGRWPDAAELGDRVAAALGRARVGVFEGSPPGEPTAVAPGQPTAARAGGDGFVEVMRAAGWRGPQDGARAMARSLPGRRCSVLLDRLDQLQAALSDADDVVLPGWRFPDLEAAADEVRARAEAAGRSPASLGVAALVPTSIGRTQAEAQARVAADALFARLGDPAEIGIFGTLEECQDRAIALAHAGISDLRCVLPDSPDIHDVVAQLTAITIGTTDVLRPGSLRSPDPPPPDGWGGRSDLPTRPRLSAGSRRR
jgi:alkanesulfonate monooxygenase SsuD/methylene tetrahydromethanopterin reductase-like flavin-dependent oxidoreductase (luciferase family)